MILYLIRHGESVSNAAGRIQGQLDIPLSDLGQRQSAALARYLSQIPLDAVISSPLRRAAETAAPIAASQGLSVRYEPLLREIHAGVFQGLLWSEISERYPDYAAPWLGQEPDFIIPGGESRRQLQTRGMAGLAAVRALGLRTVAIVAHGGVLSAALKGYLEIPCQRRCISLCNASISKVRWEEEFQLVTLNQLEHLRAEGLDREDNTGNL
ncbi:MAG: histidine phosphatase family protein [Pirellulales bacterium]|nr:histidine phosphatase family protein [Pirellulales bacterium]